MNSLFDTIKIQYLSSDTEKIIGRVTFTLRALGLLLGSWILWEGISSLIGPMLPGDLEKFTLGQPLNDPFTSAVYNVLWLVIYGIFYWVLMQLCIKRYVDLGSNIKTPKILISIFYVINTYSLCLGIYSGYFGNPIMKIAESNGIIELVGSAIGTLGIASLICIIIMVLYCMIFPGISVSDSNQG